MVVQHSVHVDLPIAAVSSALSMGPRKWFPRLERPSHAAFNPEVGGLALWSKVGVEVGEPVSGSGWTEIPVTWQASHIKHLHPVMTGKVELAAIGDFVTRLTVCADYEPSVGPVGELLDDAFLHGVAQATVKDLAESIARLLDGVR